MTAAVTAMPRKAPWDVNTPLAPPEREEPGAPRRLADTEEGSCPFIPCEKSKDQLQGTEGPPIKPKKKILAEGGGSPLPWPILLVGPRSVESKIDPSGSVPEFRGPPSNQKIGHLNADGTQ